MVQTTNQQGSESYSGKKIPRSKIRTGSIPVAGTIKKERPSPLLFYVPGIERVCMQQSGGLLLPPVRTLVASLIFAIGKNANRFRLPAV